jgi:hypothetical protein
LEHALGVCIIASGLEHPAQQMIGRNGAGVPQRRHQVGGEIEQPQPRIERATAKRRLIDGSREATGRERGERANIAWPGDAVVFAGRASHAGDGDESAEPGELPVERACEPGRADRTQLVYIGRLRPHEPAPRNSIEHRNERSCERQQPCHDGVAQGARSLQFFSGVPQGAAVADVHHRDGRKALAAKIHDVTRF